MPKLSLKEKDRITMNADLQKYNYYTFVFQKMNNIKESFLTYNMWHKCIFS